MKTISSRQLTENPKEVWSSLEKEGFFVITQNDIPTAILVPTSKQTVEKDVEEETFRRAYNALEKIGRNSVLNGTDKMTMEEIDAEIAAVRREQNNKKAV